MRGLVLCAMLFLACCRNVPQEASRRSSTRPAKEISAERPSFEDNAKATVSLSSGFVRASGVFINREGDILTSLHTVPEGADPMHAAWDASDRNRNFGAESLFWDKQLDVLVLRSNVRPESYARFAREVCPAGEAYLVGRFENGVMSFYGRYLGDTLPYTNSAHKISNYLFPSIGFSSGGGIFSSSDNSLLGINRLVVNESTTSAPLTASTIGDIKLFLRSHHINFEEIQ